MERAGDRKCPSDLQPWLIVASLGGKCRAAAAAWMIGFQVAGGGHVGLLVQHNAWRESEVPVETYAFEGAAG